MFKKKNKIRLGNGKSKKENQDGFINMGGDVHSEDFMILNNSGSNKFLFIKKIINITTLIIVICFLSALTYCLISYRIIPENVRNKEFSLGKFSVTPRYSKPNLDELEKKDLIIYKENDISWIPFVYKYKTLEFQNVDGNVILAKDEEGKQYNIYRDDVLFVLKKD